MVKEGQTKEEEWFSNESNPEFESFLDIIGKRVKLEGYTGWAAGLDTKSKVKKKKCVFHPKTEK